MKHLIVPPHLAVKAMRDNGYKNAAYALAELMDNSIQAGATKIELLCEEQIVQLAQRQGRRIKEVAVLDDAKGMDSEVLRMALQFGNGTRLEESNQNGIGRFGMGLPASSISQCRRVDVWSWQSGSKVALHSYLDLDRIEAGEMAEIPAPVAGEIPAKWIQRAKKVGDSGTLVIWSKTDKMLWKTAAALFGNSEFVVGRMYRRFISRGDVAIRMAAFEGDCDYEPVSERYITPNDPLYLTVDTSTPSPWDKEPMFEIYGDGPVEMKVKHRGRQHTVRLTFSVAKKEVRTGHSPGSRAYGRHAARNTGLSIVRADRELELDESWSDPSEPRDRWWGIEVDFPPALDSIFGVTNNKQHAHNFSEFASIGIHEFLGDRSLAEVQEEMLEEEDPRGPLLAIANQIERTRSVIRKLLRAQTANEGGSKKSRHQRNSAESKGTDVTRARQNDGHHGASDDGESMPEDERKKDISNELEQQGIDGDTAGEMAAITVSNGLKYVFAAADIGTPAFFSVRQKGGSILITLNMEHPAYEKLVEVLDPEDASGGGDDPQARLSLASDGLKLLLMAWARYEDEQPDGKRREQAQDARTDWGRLARDFLSSED